VTDDINKKPIIKLKHEPKPFADVERALGSNGAVARVLEEMERHRAILSAVSGPLEEFRRNSALTALTEQVGAVAELQKQLAFSTERFKLPEMKLAAELMASYRDNQASELFKQLIDPQDYLRQAIEAIRSPWLDIDAQTRSANAFADMQTIGFALNSIPAFDDRLTELLRIDLGDWQAKINFPKAIFVDPLMRSAFYQTQGLDPSLTAFPADAFSESLEIAGLKGDLPPVFDRYDYQVGKEAGKQEAAYARTNAAHDRLQRFETQLRHFIDKQMTKACGEQWFVHRVPGTMRQNWIEKREKARYNGEADHPLIAYADFSDYSQLITQKNNWSEVFQPFFKRSSSVQESFQRLHPIRICTMHSRMITQDDELYLFVEVKRILSAIDFT
jgi:hypothetical protein